VVTNGLAFVWTAAVVHASFAPEASLRPSSIVALSGLATALVLAKYAYVPLLGLALLISPARLEPRLRHARWLAPLFLLPIAGLAVWLFLDADPTSLGFRSGFQRPVLALVEDPVGLILAVGRTLRHEGIHYLLQLIGSFGGDAIQLPVWTCLAYVSAVGLAAVLDGSDHVQVLRWQRWLLAAIIGSALLFVHLVAYVAWTAPASRVIYGFQGRYMIPLAPSVGYLLLPSRRLVRGPTVRAAEIGVVVLAGAALAESVSLVAERFYGL
jgi:uncharacterized membrane protein